jgi:hypothetical protein
MTGRQGYFPIDFILRRSSPKAEHSIKKLPQIAWGYPENGYI